MKKIEKKVLKNLIRLDAIISNLGYLAERLWEKEIKKELPEDKIGDSVPDSTLLFLANEELGNSEALGYLCEFIKRQEEKTVGNQKIKNWKMEQADLQVSF